jgi:hypothetical protein
MSEKDIIIKSIEDSYNHVSYFELPEKLKKLSKKEVLNEIENQIELLKKKGVWSDRVSK